ncbi:MAG: hypothetical protein LBD80_01170 [Tannerella sp.]|jgi:hypothetical protein|nr:hypothetical protein [Tannerella sp.]
MEQKLSPGCAVSIFIFGSLLGMGLALLIPYYLCRIDPAIEAGWLRGMWHGGNFVGNLILTLFEDRLLKAPLHSTAYSVFWWLSTVLACIMWLLYCIGIARNLRKTIEQNA